MSLTSLGTSALCIVAMLGTACGAATRSTSRTTTRPLAPASLRHVVTSGRLTFSIPSTWAVGYGACRCGWGEPGTATLGNGPQTGAVVCNCPDEPVASPSGLHLYEGQDGLVPGGTPATVNGVSCMVRLDTSTATLTATFPGIDQWITIGPAPTSSSRSGKLRQVALEKEILATVKIAPGGGYP